MCVQVCVCVCVCVCVVGEGELMTNEIIVTILHILHILIIFPKLQDKNDLKQIILPKYVHVSKVKKKKPDMSNFEENFIIVRLF